MRTDQAFAEIFRHRPDWLALLAGRDLPTIAETQSPVFKAAVAADLLLVAADPAAPDWVCEFQLYFDHSIFVRAELSRLQRWREINAVEECRRRDFLPRTVEALIVFGARGHIPPGAERFSHIPWVVLSERRAELERDETGCALAALLRPVVETDSQVVEVRAAADYRALRENATLSEEDRDCFLEIFVQFLMQRFRNKTAEEINTMIAELTPVEETRAGRELIQRGIERVTIALLERVCGGLDSARRARVRALPGGEAEKLAMAALEFHSTADLDAWLDEHG